MEIYIPKIEEAEIVVAMAGEVFRMRFYFFKGITYADIRTGDGVFIAAGKRVSCFEWLLPKYLEIGCNFRFEAYDEDAPEYPEYNGFNDKFRFVGYLTNEMKELDRQ